METDAPFLAPHPLRGKRNEPAYVRHTAKVLAEIKGVSAADIEKRHNRQFLPAVLKRRKRRQPAQPGQQRGMTLRITILGCGSSTGVPRVGGDWGACDPNNPKNRRRRSSLLVERIGPKGVTVVVIDTSPDLREQLLKAGVTRLDAVIYTHDHADHTHGIDDLQNALLHAAPPHRRVGGPAHDGAASQALRLLFRDAARIGLPANRPGTHD